jgi:hypothetical protein
MLGTLLDKLQSFFSKNVVIGSIPLFAFLFLNALMVYRVSYHFQQWVKLYFFSQDTTRQAVLSFALLLLVTVISYVVSTLRVFLREVLEGKHFLGDFLSNALSQRYRDRLTHLEEELRKTRKRLRTIREKQETWTRVMGNAYQQGKSTLQCHYQRPAALTRLLDRRDSNQEIDLAQLDTQAEAMTTVLLANSPERDTEESRKLDLDHGALLQLIRYAADRAQEEYTRLLTEFQFDYAGEDVAPTKMGNISQVAPHYAASRYSMNLDIFWTRLQKVIESDANFYSVLQDAKTQLDFLVALVWYTLAFTLFWGIVLPYTYEGQVVFLGIVMVGPCLAYLWYRVALQNYRAFSDLLCASVDLFRLDLLKALHLPLPANAEQERLVWETIEQRLVYGEHPNIALVS